MNRLDQSMERTLIYKDKLIQNYGTWDISQVSYWTRKIKKTSIIWSKNIYHPWRENVQRTSPLSHSSLQWNSVYKVPRDKKCNASLLHSSKSGFKNKCHREAFSKRKGHMVPISPSEEKEKNSLKSSQMWTISKDRI